MLLPLWLFDTLLIADTLDGEDVGEEEGTANKLGLKEGLTERALVGWLDDEVLDGATVG